MSAFNTLTKYILNLNIKQESNDYTLNYSNNSIPEYDYVFSIQ
jgi:hypothetical protein